MPATPVAEKVIDPLAGIGLAATPPAPVRVSTMRLGHGRDCRPLMRWG